MTRRESAEAAPATDAEWHALVERVEAMVVDAGRIALEHFRAAPAVQDKSRGAGWDPVTVADREAEARLRSLLGAAFPSHGLLGEEAAEERGDARCLWTIDPIDGTRGFVSGFVQWGMLLALSVDGRVRLGVVHQPFTGELYGASPAGARLKRIGESGDRPLAVRRCERLEEAIVATTDPYLFEGREAQVFSALRSRARMVRYGGDCYAYCLLALGQLDAVVESGLAPWDVRALVPIVERAGGRITNWRGGDCSDGGQVLACGDADRHAELLELLAPAAEGPA